MPNIEKIIDAYESALVDSSVATVDVCEFIGELQGHPRIVTLIELLRIRMERQFEIGDYGGVEACVREFPYLADDVELVQQLAYEELRLRRSHQLSVHREALMHYAGTDVSWLGGTTLPPNSEASPAVDIHLSNEDWSAEGENEGAPSVSRSLGFIAGKPSLQCGEQFGPFRIVCELGSGAIARVYLAQQLDLSERWVVLKVCSRATREPHRLAELNHPNIVPIISLHEVRGFQVICMPYSGAATVEHLINSLHPTQSDTTPSEQRVSELLISTVRNRQEYVQTQVDNQRVNKRANRRFASLQQHEWLRDWQGDDLERVCCKLVLQIAVGLQHAHAAGLIHCDIKPANLLIGDDGNARLVDFNVARTLQGQGVSNDIGGTLAYMSPEQRIAFHSGMAKIGAPSDLYSLGLVFFQLLTGKLPPRAGANALANGSKRTSSSTVTPTVALEVPASLASPDCVAIVRKLLQVDIGARYQTATELIEDLQLHLESKPLRHTSGGSTQQRVHKWIRRHPKLTSAGSVASVALAVVGVLVFSMLLVQRQLEASRLDALKHDWNELLPEADLLVSTAQVYPGVRSEVTGYVDRAVAVVEQAHSQRLIADLRPIERQLVHNQLRHLHDSFARLGEVSELAQHPALLARLDVVVQATRTGMTSETGIDGEDPVLHGLPSADWQKAVEQLNRDEYAAASSSFEALLRRAPKAWPAWLLQGHCLAKLGSFLEAERAYENACILAPDTWLGWYCRGLALIDADRQSPIAPAQWQIAEECFRRALSLELDLDEARFNHAICLEHQGKFVEAIEELDGIVDSPRIALQGLLFRSRLRQIVGDVTGAIEDRDAAFELSPSDVNDYLQLGFACLESDPQTAAKYLEVVLEQRPAESMALQTLAYLTMQVTNEPERALGVLQQWIDQYPHDAVAWASRAVLFARQGDVESSLSDISEALNLTYDARVAAQLGSALALLSQSEMDPLKKSEFQRRGVSLLVQSVMIDPSLYSELEADDDIAAVREQLFKIVSVIDNQAMINNSTTDSATARME